MKKWALLLMVLAGCYGIFYKGQAMADKYEHARYAVLQAVDKSVEIRDYPPHLVAEVTVPGSREEAANKGFRQLADFIFGNNTSQQDIAMTAPVTETPAEVGQASSREKIAMTVPVTEQANGQANGKEWVVRFHMPSQYTPDTLPRPKNPNIRITTTQPQRVAAIRFSGGSNQGNLDAHEQKLREVLKDAGQTIAEGTPATYAFYNSPFTLPFLRRNEVLLPLENQP
jgi:DNA gyrase inhibitor GyrI